VPGRISKTSNNHILTGDLYKALKPQRERLPSLINLNRELAAGLRSSA